MSRLTNTVLFSVTLAMALANYASPSDLFHPGLTSWPTAERNLEVVDQTGDPAWRQATVAAVRDWNHAGAGIMISAGRRSGPCGYGRALIEVCEVPFAVLARSNVVDVQAITHTTLDGDGHISGAVISVCSDCDIGPQRRLVVVTHEVGHALGLVHTLDPTSIMYPLGGPGQPSPGDDALLRKLYPPFA